MSEVPKPEGEATSGRPIRTARRGDIPHLVDLRVQFLGEAVHDEPRLRLLSDVRERTESALPVWMEQEGRLILVAEGDGGVPAGYAMGMVDTQPPLLEHQHVGVVAECYVVAQARGAGLGRGLIALLAEMLTARGAQVLRASVPARNAVAVRRFAEAGFEPLQYTMARTISSD